MWSNFGHIKLKKNLKLQYVCLLRNITKANIKNYYEKYIKTKDYFLRMKFISEKVNVN